MSLLQSAYETYCNMEAIAGEYIEGYQPLAPVSHAITSAAITVVLDQDGNFISASVAEPEKIIIPVTVRSATRTRAIAAHPLCDQLGYLDGLNREKYASYVDQLEKWCDSKYSHPKLRPILHYVQSGEILKDLTECGLVDTDPSKLEKDEKKLVRWQIQSDEENGPQECWKDKSLFRAFTDYYDSVMDAPKGFCMITGNYGKLCKLFPKNIIPFYANAKLISSDDKSGFTYRSRFEEPEQVATISYEAAQKAHAALRWLVVNQGVYVGGRVFLCWNPEQATDPDGIGPSALFRPLAQEETPPASEPYDYRRDFRSALLGFQNKIPTGRTIIAALDATTDSTGRLSLVYYNEFQTEDFARKLMEWDESCCWYRWIDGKVSIQPLWLRRIADCAFGSQRVQAGRVRFVLDDKEASKHVQRLMDCRIEGKRIPEDICRSLVNRASRPLAYDPFLWRELVITACAVIQSINFHANKQKEAMCMEWPLDKKDRSFQFGRLLAAMEKAEEDYYFDASRPNKTTNAIKELSAFKQRPMRVAERVNEKLEISYLPRMKEWRRNGYRRLRGEIMEILSQCDGDMNAPLNEFYLVGYSLQRNQFFKKSEAIEPNNQEE